MSRYISSIYAPSHPSDIDNAIVLTEQYQVNWHQVRSDIKSACKWLGAKVAVYIGSFGTVPVSTYAYV